MFFFGFQARIRKIMLKGKEKTFSFLPLFSDSGPMNLELKHLEQDYAAIFIHRGLELWKSTGISEQTGPTAYK